MVATCNPGGAGKWRDEFTTQLAGAQLVVVLPDNDQPGCNHAAQVAASLRRRCACTHRPATGIYAEKGDVSDWIATGHTAADLEALIDAQAEADRGEAETEQAGTATRPRRRTRSGLSPDRTRQRRAIRRPARQPRRVCRRSGLLAYDERRGIYVANRAVLVRYAKTTVRSIYGEAAANLNEKTRKAIAAHAQRSESKKAIDAMLALAEAEQALEADAKDFDADPELLNCTNGVVDLRTGTCRAPLARLPHD